MERGKIWPALYGMFRSPLIKYLILAAIASGICGFFHALPLLGALPTQAGRAAAIRGIASEHNLEGYGVASGIDLVAGRLWQSGGAPLLAAGQWLAVFGGWAAMAFVVLGVVSGIALLLNDGRTRRILVGSAILLLLMTCVPPAWQTISKLGDRVSDLRLVLPVELINQVPELDERKTFANPSALGHMMLIAPHAAGRVSLADSARLSKNSTQWREEFRRVRWNAVLLSGAIGEYRPLLEHLIDSPDWHLASVTNHGFLFLYGAGLPARSLDSTFHFGNNQDTAVYLAQITPYYDAIRRTADARTCIERALQIAPENVLVLSHAATFAAAHKRWQDAMSYARRVLSRDDLSSHAKLIQTLALLETGEAAKAQELVNQVLLQAPDDPYTLFLSARIGRALNDYVTEAESLEKVVAIAQRAGTSTANYRIYLGQAYAKQSLADPALQHYRAALNSGQLNAEQVEEVQDAIRSIEAATP